MIRNTYTLISTCACSSQYHVHHHTYANVRQSICGLNMHVLNMANACIHRTARAFICRHNTVYLFHRHVFYPLLVCLAGGWSVNARICVCKYENLAECAHIWLKCRIEKYVSEPTHTHFSDCQRFYSIYPT